MGRFKDLTGKVFNRLSVVKIIGKTKNRETIWLCKCKCGNQLNIPVGNLASGHTKSCGCLKSELISKRSTNDISGQRFKKLVALQNKYKNHHGESMWRCQCDCGEYTTVLISNLTSGRQGSCGKCQNRVNGKTVSFPQIAVAEMLDGELNYLVGSCYVDIAIPDEKIAIEYDSWFWHAHKIQQDRSRANVLMEQGWKVISIKSNSKIPKKKRILLEMRMLDTYSYRELVLSDWGKGKTHKEVYG